VSRNSSVGTATLRAGRSGHRNQVGTRFSAHMRTSPGVHPASWTMGDRVSFPGVNRPGRRVDHSPHLEPGVKERVQL